MPSSVEIESDRHSRKISHRTTRSSPSDHDTRPHRRDNSRDKRRSMSRDRRSGRRDHVASSKSHRESFSRPDSSSPPPAKRRRSEERSLSPARRSHHREQDHNHRSRSPYRRDDRKTKKRKDESLSQSRSRSRTALPRRKRRHDDSRSRSPPAREPSRKHSSKRSPSPAPARKSRQPLPSQEVAYRGPTDGNSEVEKPIVKEKPNFKPTGLLAKESNTIAGTKVVLKYNEPSEGRKPPPSQKWQLFIFKGDDVVEEIPLWTRSCWLIGREAAVADLLVEHPSCSKQHAVIQFRHSVKTNEFGDKTNIVRPYVIDLESANGTRLNGEKIKDSRYYEVRDKDLLKIGLSDRDYVFMLPPS